MLTIFAQKSWLKVMIFKDVFGYRLFYWNWKIIAKSTVNKSKS